MFGKRSRFVFRIDFHVIIIYIIILFNLHHITIEISNKYSMTDYLCINHCDISQRTQLPSNTLVFAFAHSIVDLGTLTVQMLLLECNPKSNICI